MLNQLDISILRSIHHNRIEELDSWFYILSYITSYISFGIILALLLVAIVKKSKQVRGIFYKMLAVLILAASISFVLKTVITRERPFITYPDIEKLSEAGSSSFPSGHTIEVFAMAAGLSLLIPKKKVIIPVFTWALLVAYSRMALGVHFPSDVFTGMIVGSAIGWLVPFLIGKVISKRNKEISGAA
jgi:membrane-associated phospholipid phosphatase